MLPLGLSIGVTIPSDTGLTRGVCVLSESLICSWDDSCLIDVFLTGPEDYDNYWSSIINIWTVLIYYLLYYNLKLQNANKIVEKMKSIFC